MSAINNKIEPIVIERIYKHPVKKVFDAFSHKAAFEQWVAPSNEINTNILIHEFKIGGQYRIEFTVPEVGTLFLAGEYVHIERHKQICFTWVWEKPDIHAGINSLVTADFLDHGEYTRLIITHENLSMLQVVERHTQGWNGALRRLDNFLIKLSNKQD